ILFEHKTWKDFRSAISVTRLQDEYNQYICDCDIVVFLFHTRIGQYTLEEFEVAHKQFLNSKGKKPLIYVFFKNSDNIHPDISAFKQKNINLGHFYDTYFSNEELLLKFERQLQILENEGVIKPNPIDLKKIVKYGLFFVFLPLLILFLGYFTIEYFSPLDMTVKIKEVRSIPSVPFTEGEIRLTYENQSEMKTVKDEVIFKQIAAKYKGKTANVIFTAQGYETIDTMIRLRKMVELPVKRDNSLGLIFGTVKDENNRPLKDVTVSVQDIKTQTDETGAFRVTIPFEKQKEEQRLTAYKEGYQLWDFTATPSQTIDWKIILKK
ncbi:MAG: carboxypeptidase-like regulatory domain-containing protein, partial [Prevotellaceae bacterium]|nr:carboxypeptidase-like regulatory domain-containing protein [Prevotellaceae bacterium]